MAVSISKPQVGADADSWGTKLNVALDALVDGHNGATGTTPDLLSGWAIGGTAVTADASELNKLDGVTVSTAEINHLAGVSSNIQTQINAAASSGGTTYSTSTYYGTTMSGTQIRMHSSYSGGNWSCNNGSISASGDITAFSDARLKTDVVTIPNALNKVEQMRGVYYTKDGKSGVGVIAQEMQKVLPEVVADGEYLSVAYGNIVGVLIEAIKELKAEIEALKHDDTNK